MANAFEQRIIVCAGLRFRRECAEVINGAANEPTLSGSRFLMSEWCSADQFRQAAFVWIVDESEPWVPIHFALTNALPLLVPEDNSKLKQLCIEAACGLYYQNASEARHCIQMLLTREALRSRMGQNGYNYVSW